MRSSVAAMGAVFILLCAVPGLAKSAYPYELQRKLEYTIGDNPFVTVGAVYEREDGGHGIDVVCTTADTGQGIAFMLNTDYEWGEHGILVAVLDEQGNPIEVDESALTGDPIQDTRDLILKALRYNRLYVGMPGDVPWFAPYDVYLEVRPEVVQFWNDDLSNYDSNSTFMVEAVFREVCKDPFFDDAVRVAYTSAPKYARSGSLDGFVPAAAHTPGKFNSVWTTDLWVYHDNASTLELWYNQEGVADAAPHVTISLDEGVLHLSDVVATLFEADGHGSISYLADSPVRVVSRTWTPAEDGGTYGQVIPGVPGATAAERIFARPGETQALVNQREGFRANLGLVNASGDPMTVDVNILTADGSPAPGDSSFTVDLEPWGMKQLNDVLSRLEPGEREGLVISAQVAENSEGALIAYLSEVDNTTNDPSYQEAFQF